jgi:branched-chain amino acid transport system substrate-binding protein
MKKKFAFLFASLFLLGACSAGPSGGDSSNGNSNGGGNTQEGDTIKIGLNLELSGAVAGYGTQEK